MSSESNKRLDEYSDKIKQYDEKNDYDGILKIVEEYRIYLEALMAIEQNQANRSWYLSLQVYTVMMRRYALTSKKLIEMDRDYNSRINSLTNEITHLKARLTAIEKGV